MADELIGPAYTARMNELYGAPDQSFYGSVGFERTHPDNREFGTRTSDFYYKNGAGFQRIGNPNIFQNSWAAPFQSSLINDPEYGYSLPVGAYEQLNAATPGYGKGDFKEAAALFGGTVLAPIAGSLLFGGGAGTGATGAEAGGGAVGGGSWGGSTADLMRIVDPQAGMLQSIPGMSTPTGLVTPEMLLRTGGLSGGQTAASQPGSFQDLITSAGRAISSPINALKGGLSAIFGAGGEGGGTGGGNSPFGLIGDILSIGSGIYGLTQSRKLKELAERASQQADPFGPYRAGFADQLMQLQADPSRITKLPGYAAGEQAVQRSMAAQGYQGSGNMMTALQKYGGDAFNAERNFLANAAGAGFNPASGAQALLTGNQSAIDLAGRSLASIGYGVGGKSPGMELLERLARGV